MNPEYSFFAACPFVEERMLETTTAACAGTLDKVFCSGHSMMSPTAKTFFFPFARGTWSVGRTLMRLEGPKMDLSKVDRKEVLTLPPLTGI